PDQEAEQGTREPSVAFFAFLFFRRFGFFFALFLVFFFGFFVDRRRDARQLALRFHRRLARRDLQRAGNLRRRFPGRFPDRVEGQFHRLLGLAVGQEVVEVLGPFFVFAPLELHAFDRGPVRR